MEGHTRDTGKTVHQTVRQTEETLQTTEESIAPPSQATANFQKSLDAVVPACLVLKYAANREYPRLSSI